MPSGSTSCRGAARQALESEAECPGDYWGQQHEHRHWSQMQEGSMAKKRAINSDTLWVLGLFRASGFKFPWGHDWSFMHSFMFEC